jgi:hypothetical protein
VQNQKQKLQQILLPFMRTTVLFLFLFIYNLSLAQNKPAAELTIQNSTERLGTYFSNNLWGIKEGKKYGLYDSKNKKIVIPIQYDIIIAVYDNGKIVSVEADKKSFLVDLQNKPVSNKYDGIRSTSSPSTLIAEKDNKSILIDLNGKEKGPWYDKIDSTYGSEILMAQSNALYGAIDLNGTIKIPFKYQSIELGSSKKIKAQLNNQWGIIDENNNVLVDFKYDNIEPSQDEYIVTKNKKKGVLDHKNKLIINCLYDGIYGTSDKLDKQSKYRQVKIEDKIGLIDSIANIIIPAEYENLNFFEDLKYNKRIMALKNNKWGIIDFNNKVIVPFEYEKIKRGGYSEIIEYLNAVPNEKSKVKNWSFNENDFVYFVKSNGEYIIINEKQKVLYKK